MLGVGDGAIAQLGEHLLCKQGVVGSIPTGSTSCRNVGVEEFSEGTRKGTRKQEAGEGAGKEVRKAK